MLLWTYVTESMAFGRCYGLSTIYFQGNAPWISSNVFWEVVANAYYPQGNSTWTRSKKSNYGGSLTWLTCSHIIVTDSAMSPTCTETGLTEGKHCSVCNAVLVKQEIIAAVGHTEVVDEAIAPTCINTGRSQGSRAFCINKMLKV